MSVKNNKKTKEKILVFSGKNYNLKYSDEFDTKSDEDVEIIVDKEYFKFLDNEKYKVYGNSEYLLFFSEEYPGEMKLALGGLVDPTEDDTDDE